ncbi:MAG: hypothetical protein Q8L07_04245 [Sediminibacterium sp.]|nr:hypothetical protein [Sediminibacterium sp.]
MITGRTNTVNWLNALSEMNFPYWTIYWKGKTDSGHFVFKSSQEDGFSMSDSLADLRNKLNMLGYGQYTIIAQSKPGNVGKGAAKEDFEVTTLESQQSQQQPNIGAVQQPVNMAGYVTKEEAMELAEKRFKEMMLQKENDDLKKQLSVVQKEKAELEKEADSGTTRIINMVAGIVEPMLKPAVAQVGTLGMAPVADPAPVVIDQNDMAARLEKVLNECEEIFGQPAIPFLEKLMEKVKAQPFMVSMVKNALQ